MGEFGRVVRAWREGFALSGVAFRWIDAAQQVLFAALPDIVKHLKIGGAFNERVDFRRGRRVDRDRTNDERPGARSLANAGAISFSTKRSRHVEIFNVETESGRRQGPIYSTLFEQGRRWGTKAMDRLLERCR